MPSNEKPKNQDEIDVDFEIKRAILNERFVHLAKKWAKAKEGLDPIAAALIEDELKKLNKEKFNL